MRPFSHLRPAPWTGERAARLLALVLTFACAEAAVHGLLRLAARTMPVPEYAVRDAADAVQVSARQAARLYGAPVVAPREVPRRFRLFGVIGGGEHAGSALIGVDGGPAQAFPVGAEIAPGVRLLATSFGHVQIAQHGRRSVLDSEPAQDGAVALPREAGPGALQGAGPRPAFLPPREAGYRPQGLAP